MFRRGSDRARDERPLTRRDPGRVRARADLSPMGRGLELAAAPPLLLAPLGRGLSAAILRAKLRKSNGGKGEG